VILVALLLMEWRSALVVALAIPLTVALTFIGMQLLGIPLHQISIAALIIALGMLVDDPVVASDAINREFASGAHPGRGSVAGPVAAASRDPVCDGDQHCRVPAAGTSPGRQGRLHPGAAAGGDPGVGCVPVGLGQLYSLARVLPASRAEEPGRRRGDAAVPGVSGGGPGPGMAGAAVSRDSGASVPPSMAPDRTGLRSAGAEFRGGAVLRHPVLPAGGTEPVPDRHRTRGVRLDLPDP
jgi:hypothetical protein